MVKRFQDKDEIENSISLLVSILIRHPEVSTVNYEPGKKCLSFSFMLNKLLSDIEFDEFKAIIVDSLNAYSVLTEGECPDFDFRKYGYDNITIIEIERDIYTLTSDEISLIMSLISNEFGDNVVSDGNNAVDDDEMHDEAIDNMIENVKDSCHTKNLYGYRDDGRVLVFNKSVHKSKS